MSDRLCISSDTIMFSSGQIDVIRAKAGEYTFKQLYTLIGRAMLDNYLGSVNDSRL